MSTITITKGNNNNYLLLLDGVEVGDTFKYRRGIGWVVRLRDIYWRKGEPNLRSGSTTIGIPRLKDAPEFAEKALEKVGKK